MHSVRLIFFTFLLSMLVGCDSTDSTTDIGGTQELDTDATTSTKTLSDYLVDYEHYVLKSEDSSGDISSLLLENMVSHEEDGDYEYASTDIQEILLDDENMTIESAGVYKVSGTISDGQLLIEAGDEDVVKLILDGIDITSSSSAPLFVKSAAKVIIILATDSSNTLTDTSENEEKGTLLSKSDLSITGDGGLSIYCNANDALRSNDGLIIKDADIDIVSVDDGIRGKDYLIIEDGTFTIRADGDGLKSDNEDEEDRGYIYISGGVFTIDSLNDAIQAQTDLLISGGTFSLITADGSSATISDDTSAKGLKSDGDIMIDGGDFTIDSADDTIHCDSKIIINGGDFTLSSGDDGIHSDVSLEINGGRFDIAESYEGLESSSITINNGYIDITSSDDGINVAGDEGTSDHHLHINGGFTVVDAAGDGLDANGYISMNDGIVIINGPTSGGDGAIDHDRTFTISAGVLIAVGSSNMAETASDTSSQNSILVKFDSSLSAGSLVNIKDSSGEDLMTFQPQKDYRSLAFSSSGLVDGSYTINVGGNSTGESHHGVYEGGTYSDFSLYKSLTISSTVTMIR